MIDSTLSAATTTHLGNVWMLAASLGCDLLRGVDAADMVAIAINADGDMSATSSTNPIWAERIKSPGFVCMANKTTDLSRFAARIRDAVFAAKGKG
jgi:hypothetical protein